MKKSFITGIIAIALMLTVGGTVAHADDYISSKFPPEDLIVAWGTCSMGTSSTGWVYAGKTKDPSVPNSYYVYLYYRFDTGEAGSGTSFRLTRLDTNRWYIEPQKLMDSTIQPGYILQKDTVCPGVSQGASPGVKLPAPQNPAQHPAQSK